MISSEERLLTMATKDANHRCAVFILAEGFEEAETIALLSLLRQASVCVKIVGLTRGPIRGTHGVYLMPDLTLTDAGPLVRAMAIGAVILPEGRRGLARLETDPRVHRLLRQVVEQHGWIVASAEGLRVARAAGLWVNGPEDAGGARIILHEPGQSTEIFAQELVRRLKWMSRAKCQESH
jgi:putative intracellular protease/amidase